MPHQKQTRGLFWKRLKAHPGVPVASAMTAVFLFAGLSNPHSQSVGLASAIIFSAIMWAVVLWTARTNPLPQD